VSSTALYQARLKAVRLATAAAVQARFAALSSYDSADAELFARAVAPVVAAGQLTAARTAVAYLSRRARVPPVRVGPAQVTGPAARRGVALADEYQRPFGVVWHALAEGHDFAKAIQLGSDRAGLLAVTDVWLATRAASAVLDEASPKITGWLRAADASACELCDAADGMPLAQAADMAGHPNCGCTSEPSFEQASSAELPAAVVIEEHDELGPVLRASS
jgi:hypothetical protein